MCFIDISHHKYLSVAYYNFFRIEKTFNDARNLLSILMMRLLKFENDPINKQKILTRDFELVRLKAAEFKDILQKCLL